MPTLFKYKKIVTSGPNGQKVDFNNQDTQGDSATSLMEIDGWHYVSVPDGLDMPEQPPEINWQQVTADAAIIEQLKKSKPIAIAKDRLRKKIESEIGDLHDLVSDSMRLNEFALLLCLRVSHQVLTGEPMSAENKAAYIERVELALQGIDSGNVILRGDIEDPAAMIQRLMARYSKLTELVRDEYKHAVDKIIP